MYLQTEDEVRSHLNKEYSILKKKFPQLKSKALQEKTNALLSEIFILCSPELGIKKPSEIYKFFSKRKKITLFFTNRLSTPRVNHEPDEGDGSTFLDDQIKKFGLNTDPYF